MEKISSKIQTFSEYICQASNIVVFTGAGISTESGISDYRSKGGIWERFVPVTIQEFLASEEKRKIYWQRKLELFETFGDAKPNQGHYMIVRLEKMGKLKGIITQNIDGLHQLAGSCGDKILEIHGSNRETICLSCGDLRPWEDVYKRLKSGEEVPLCLKCKGFLKPNTISFGQALDQDVLRESMEWASQCDLMLAIGSTLVVEPAASLPRIAKQNGAKLVIITLSETPLDAIADLKISAGIGETLSAALNRRD
ncbi:MAG: NAD-dependent deacylase [Candidatus Omnitrophica bacterium]|nr:NAD-dependent deacylase [Candidatus Omnitrophota bacterium]